MMKNLHIAALAALALVGAAPGIAGAGEIKARPKAVLELFTSQGCSSCPPADALMTSLDDDPELITLAYHVDYWDYIGWKDTFSHPAFANLQRAYAQAQSRTGVYTPQLVVNGEQDVVGSRPSAVNGAVASASLSVPVVLVDDGDMLDVSIVADPTAPESVVWLVTFKSNAEVQIERGENSGRKIDYTQIVTGRTLLGMWAPVDGTHIRLPLKEILGTKSDGAVIILQEDRGGLPGKVIGAASYQL